MTKKLSEGFFLDEGATESFRPSMDLGDRWMDLVHMSVACRGFVLIPQEEITTPGFTVESEQRVRVRAARVIEQPSEDGFELELFLRTSGGDLPLASLRFDPRQHHAAKLSLDISLAPYANQRGVLVLRCLPGTRGMPNGDWCALLEFSVGDSMQLPRLSARANASWRAANEAAHFSAGGYSHAIYHTSGEPEGPGGAVKVEPMPGPRSGVRGQGLLDMARASVQALEPRQGETAFHFVVRLLGSLLPAAPAFEDRLRAMERPDPIRVLSICAGTGRVEGGLIRDADVPVQLTVLDTNESLLAQAGGLAPATSGLRLWLGSAEQLDVESEFDVAIVVSGLHHLPDLEGTLARVRRTLAPGGEFWVIGEQVGRNGNRLWPDAYRCAQAAFSELPERLRVNRASGLPDVELPNHDLSMSTFEGVRSQDIPQALAREFRIVVEDRRNCFLWRMIDLTYHDNFDLDRQDDVAVLRELVAQEYVFFAEGGLGTELNGVYRPKLDSG